MYVVWIDETVQNVHDVEVSSMLLTEKRRVFENKGERQCEVTRNLPFMLWRGRVLNPERHQWAHDIAEAEHCYHVSPQLHFETKSQSVAAMQPHISRDCGLLLLALF